ncbi:MAG: hypothetical protein WCI74_16910 [Actinomycetes bacterium]
MGIRRTAAPLVALSAAIGLSLAGSVVAPAQPRSARNTRPPAGRALAGSASMQ